MKEFYAKANPAGQNKAKNAQCRFHVAHSCTLKKKTYKHHFGQYAWMHMIFMVVFIRSSFIVANIFEQIFWFLRPASLILINYVADYIFGFFFGRTHLIKLSPNKTCEDFIEASVVVFASVLVFLVLLWHDILGGALLTEFQEGDAKALVAYLNILKQLANIVDVFQWLTYPNIVGGFQWLTYPRKIINSIAKFSYFG